MMITGYALVSREMLLAVNPAELRVLVGCMTSLYTGNAMVADAATTLGVTENYILHTLERLRDRGVIFYNDIRAITIHSNPPPLPAREPRPTSTTPVYPIWEKANNITPCPKAQSLGVIKQMLGEGYTEEEILSLYAHLAEPQGKNGFRNVSMPMVKKYIAQWRVKRPTTNVAGWLEYVSDNEKSVTL